MAAATCTPSEEPLKLAECIHAFKDNCECCRDYINEEAHNCDRFCDCPCIDCCIVRFASAKKACVHCGGTPLEGTYVCKDCEPESDSDSDCGGYDHRDDERYYDDSDRDDYDDRDDDAGCTCFRCGCAYDPDDSDYGGRACSEACFEGWGEEGY